MLHENWLSTSLSDSKECKLLTESRPWEKHTKGLCITAFVGINIVEVTDFPALSITTLLLLLGPLQLRFVVGFTTCIFVCTGRGRTGTLLLFSNLGIVSYIVVL